GGIVPKFVNSPSISIVADSQICGCDDEFSTIDAISEDIVCARPVPNRSDGPWTAVCSSHSYTTYMPDDSSMAPLGFTCTSVLDEVSVSCDGGCAYGQECRVSTESASAGMSFCADVIVDAGLRAVVSELVPAEYKEDGSGLFSVASLKNISPPITLSFTWEDSDEVSGLSNIAGIEHIRSLSTLILSNHYNLVDASPLSTLSELVYIDLSFNNIVQGDFVSNLSNVEFLNMSNNSLEGYFPFMTLSHDSIYYLDFSNNSDLTGLFLSSTYDGINNLGYPQLSHFDINRTSISDISSIFPDLVTDSSSSVIDLEYLIYLDISNTLFASSNNQFLSHVPNLTSFYASSCDIEDISGLCGHSPFLEHVNVSNNSIIDPSPLFLSQSTLKSIDLTNNMICGIDESYFDSNIFSQLENLAVSPQNTDNCSLCPTLSDLALSNDNKICLEIFEDIWMVSCSYGSLKAYNEVATDGFYCETITDPSDLEMCINLTTLKQCVSDDQGGIVIKCIEGWYGESCTDECPSHPSSDVLCSGLGVCNPLTHSCLCAWGFSGDACQWNMCAIGYGEYGYDSECFDHGSCVAGDSSKNEPPFYCSCKVGWGGMFCERDICLCDPESSKDGTEELVRDPSSDVLCSGLGVCNPLTHSCLCAWGFSGDACQWNMCAIGYGEYGYDSECFDHGSCVAGDSSKNEPPFYCSCKVGWGGMFCERDICLCDPESSYGCATISDGSRAHQIDVLCSGLGVCNPLTHSCLCAWGFSGDACQWNMCAIGYGEYGYDSECFDHGSCVAGDSSKNEPPFYCSCKVGWGGMFCERDICLCDPESSYGCATISDGSRACKCKEGWYGRACERRYSGSQRPYSFF
ncbi:hypothetical protein ADUPG1_009079, partial [Aduncisulcus paluster]